MWVLIVIMISNVGITSFATDFTTKTYCEAALTAVKREHSDDPSHLFQVEGICIEK